MSIRLQLLVIALTTLVLPWAGCRYAAELEATLRISQENALQAAAGTIAHALSAQPERVLRDFKDDDPFDPARGDVYVYPLLNQPLLDGYREDWGLAAEPTRLPSTDGLPARLQAGSTERYLFLFLEVDDPKFDAEPSNVHPDVDDFDRVNLTIQQTDDTVESYFFATSAPGPVEAQTTLRGDDGIGRAAFEPRIQAFWLQTSHGYTLEARIPRSLLGSRLWIRIIDGSSGRGAGILDIDLARGGRLFLQTPGLDALLATFIAPGTRATVVDANALKRGSAGSLAQTNESLPPSDETWYRRFIAADTSHFPLQSIALDHLEGKSVAQALAGHPTAQWLRTTAAGGSLLSAAAPIQADNRTRGAVILEQPGSQLLYQRDRALTRLFFTTLLGTALAASIAFGVAALISVRIRRLQSAADTAVMHDGRIRLTMPESQSVDEIGALARSFEGLLARLNEHALYFRTLGAKLSHELRTPLSIVRSSLDNLESEGARPDQQAYVNRAREGVLRLQFILSALGAAARVEDSIKQADRISFDLRDVIRTSVAAYCDAFPSARIEAATPDEPCSCTGAPDLIVQMLDKLVENAIDYCSASGSIIVSLKRVDASYEIAVDNDGSVIELSVLTRLFESLFEHRQGVDDRPHFGLGLYIVRLIAEFHGGQARAANRSDGSGAVFTVVLPMI